jgi:ribosomal protein S24E
VEATPSKHLWRGTLATDLAVGENRVVVRYFDPWRGEQRAATAYRLDDAAP